MKNTKRSQFAHCFRTRKLEFYTRRYRILITVKSVPMRAVLAVFILLFAFQQSHSQNLFITSHFDLSRETPIFGSNYSYPVSEKVLIVGFAEMWYNPENYAYPENSWPVFSKHWVSYELTSRLSLSMEIEVSRNLAGAWSRSSILGAYTFEPDRWYAQPKIGASFRVL